MLSAKKIEGFFRYNEHERHAGNPILRSSALFYVMEGAAFHTDLLFLNYWKIKRSLGNLRLRLTLRNLAGSTIHVNESEISFEGAWTLNVSDLLAQRNLPQEFEGSIEVEIVSKENMFIPYPAIIVRYHGSDWHTTTHSYSRILSANSGDSEARMEALQQTVEGNWTVPAEKNFDTFFVVHNGPKSVEPHEIRIRLINYDGKVLEKEREIAGYGPFETRKYYLSQFIDVAAFLQGKPGTVEVSTCVHGVFPRMLAGFEDKRTGQISVDHSNFNYTGEGGAQDSYLVSEKPSPSIKSLGFSVPVLDDPNWNCFVDFYPTYPGRNYSAKVTSLDETGRALRSESIRIGEKQKANGLCRVLVKEDFQSPSGFGSVDFVIDHEVSVPSRFHMGVHYQFKDGLPAFLIDGPMPFVYKGKFTRWFPVIDPDRAENLWFITNQVFDAGKPETVNFEIAVYNDTSLGGNPLMGELSLKPGSTFSGRLSDLMPELKKHLGGKNGWAYVRSDKANYSVMHYLSVFGKNSLALDHAF